jgi:hypothetical protein
MQQALPKHRLILNKYKVAAKRPLISGYNQLVSVKRKYILPLCFESVDKPRMVSNKEYWTNQEKERTQIYLNNIHNHTISPRDKLGINTTLQTIFIK